MASRGRNSGLVQGSRLEVRGRAACSTLMNRTSSNLEPRTSNDRGIQWRGERGAALLLTFLMLLVFAGLALAASVASHNSLLIGKAAVADWQASYVAEAGLQRARQALVAGTWSAAASPGNTYTETFGAGEYSVTIVDNGGDDYTITSEGYVPSEANPAAQRQMVEDGIAVTVSDGTNLALSATASASSTNGGNVASNAKDGDNGTKWEAGTNGSGQWLAMDLGSSLSLNKIVVEESNRIDGVSIEASDNGSSWSAVSGVSVVEDPNKTWTATFTAVSHQHFRAVFTASDSDKKVSVKEMECYSSALSSLGNGEVGVLW